MSIARSALVVGPARCLFTPTGGSLATFFTNDSFEAKLNIKAFEVQPQGFTQADNRDEDRSVEWETTPDGRWNTAMIAALWPYLNSVPGASMGSSADQPFIAHGADAGLLTVISAYVKKMPSLTFSAKKTLIGSVGWKGIIGSNMDPDDASSFLTYAATGGTLTDSGFTLSAIKTQPYSAIWTGVTGFAAVGGFFSEEGFEVSFDTSSKEIIVDGVGVADERIQKVGVMVKCKPVGPTAAEILAALKFQGTGNTLGRSHAAGGAALTITGADGVNYFTSPKMSLVSAGYRFGNDVLRSGEIGFVANMNPASGVQGALCTLAAS